MTAPRSGRFRPARRPTAAPPAAPFRPKKSMMFKSTSLRALLPTILLGGLLAAPSWGGGPALDETRLGAAGGDSIDWRLEDRDDVAPARAPDAAVPGLFELAVDDGTAEADFGVGGATARQFLWLNRLTAPRPLRLEEIQVLFPPASGDLDIGAPIDLVVY